MKGSLCILVLAATLQVAVLQETEAECPNPIPAECAGSNVCENALCPRYTSTKCCVELVDGECVAQIRRLPRLNVVTDKCMQGIDSCLTKNCPQRRTCMEEVIECPESKPDCGIRRVKATCVLNEIARAPSSCDEIVCGEGTSCVVSEGERGTKVECMKVEPKSCDELECDDGMQCVERVKPRCIPIRPEVRPSDCSQLECPESLVCMLLEGNRGARCAKPPIPTSCMELECDPGLVCEQVGNNERVRCVLAEVPPPRTLPPLPPSEPGSTGELPTRRPPPPPIRIARRCDEIDCEDSYECKLVIDRAINLNRQPVATCMPRECPLRRRARPPSRCEEIQCERDEMCVLCGEGREIRARCQRRGPRDDNEDMEDRMNMSRPMDGRDQGRDDDRSRNVTRPTGGRDEDREGDRAMMRRPPMLCSELVCGPEDMEKCQEFKLGDGRPQRALCIPLDVPDNCEDADCDKDSEMCIELENEEVKVAHCVPNNMRPPRNNTRPEVTRAPPTGSPRTRPEGTRMLPTGGPRPTQPTMPDRPRPAQRCEELDCGRGFECLHMRRDDRRRAMCVRMRRNEMCRPPRPDDDRPTGRPDRPTGRPDRPTGRPTGRPDRPTGRPTGRPDRPTGRPTGRPDRPTGRPTGRPDRPTGRPDRPTGRPDRPTGRPTGRPDRPTGRPDRPTGRPDRPTGRPDRERPTGEPDKEKPTGSPERERPTGKPKDEEDPDLDKKPTDSPMEGGNDGKGKEKRSAKPRPSGRGGKKEDSGSEDSQSDKSMSNSASLSEDSTTPPDEVGKDKSSTTGRDGGRSKDLGSSGEGSGEGESTETKGKLKLKGKDKMVDKLVVVELGEEDQHGRPKKPENPTQEGGEEVDQHGKLKNPENPSQEGEVDQHGKPKELENPTQEVEVELDENGQRKKKPEDEAVDEAEDKECDPQVELDENGERKELEGGCDEGKEEEEEGEEEETTAVLDSEEEEKATDEEEEVELDEHGKMKLHSLTRRARQTSDRVPLVDILTAVHRPDLCMERRCCEGESCFVRRIAENLPPLAFCAPDDFEGERPPMPRPPTCEELLCEEGFECVQRRGRDDDGDDRRPDEEESESREEGADDEGGSGESSVSREDREDGRRGDNDNDDRRRRLGGAVCVRRRPDRPTEPTTRRPRPTRDPNRPRPTTGDDRPRPTRGPRPTGGPSDRPRPTRDPVRPTRPSIPLERPE